MFCFLASGVIAVSAFAGNTFAYYDGSTSYSDAPRTQIGNITYILKENVQYGDNVKVPYSATVVGIPNIKKVEIPEKITCDGLEFLVTDVDLCGELFVYPKKPNIYTNVEEVELPDTIYNITEFAYFPKIAKVNIPKNTAIGRFYSEGFVDYDYSQNKYIVDKTIYYSDTGSKRVVFDDFSLADHYGYFRYCNAKLKLSVDPNNPYYSYKNDMLLSKDGKKVYMSFNDSTSITVPDGVETLSSFGGYGFYHVKNIKLPNSLKKLWAHLSAISEITLPNGLEEIGTEVFANSKITKITLPNNLKTIGWGAFSDTKLTKIVIPNSVKEIGEKAFIYSKIKSIKLGKNLTKIGARAFTGCNNLKSITVPKKVKEIHQGAFESCKKLKNAKILSKNVEIGGWAFADCKNLKIVTIQGTKKMDAHTFDNCKKLSKIIINNKKKVPKITSNAGFKNTKKGIKFVVKNKKVAKQLKKSLKNAMNNSRTITIKKCEYHYRKKGYI